MVKRYEHRHGGMMPVNREVDTYVSSSDYAKLETERDELQDEHAQTCRGWMSICGTQENEIEALTAERDALRDALRSILNDCESVLDQFYPESIALARTALGDSNG